MNMNSDTIVVPPVKPQRGRKPLKPEDKKPNGIRHIVCPCCHEAFKFDYRDPKMRRERVVDPTLSPRSKRLVYAQRNTKKPSEV